MYYLEKKFKAGHKYYSCDEGAFDSKRFETYEEAKEYAINNVCRIDSNEALVISREEVNE